MTIRLLSTYGRFSPNTIVTLASGTETALVAAGNASTDLSGGVPFDHITPQNFRQNAIAYGTDGVALGYSDSAGNILQLFNGISAPGAPTSPTISAFAGGVLVSFTAPASNGGTIITGYEVTLSTGQKQLGGTTTVAVNAPAGVAVTATVKAINGAGLSAASAATASATPTSYSAPAKPGAPTGPTLTAGNNMVTAAWGASAANGATVRNYLVKLSNNRTVAVDGSTLTATIPSPNGTAVTATVRASNDQGQSAASAVSNSVTPAASAPPTATPAVMAAVPLNGRVLVNTSFPVSAGATGVRVTASTGQSVLVDTNSYGFVAAVVPGLTNGTPATFTAKLVNGSGDGPASAASAAITPVAAKRRSVSQNTFVPDATHPSNKQASVEQAYIAEYDLTTLGVVFSAWYVSSRFETNSNGSETWKAEVRYNGQVKQITFNSGAASVTISPGSNAISDEVTLGFTIPKGAEYTIYCFYNAVGTINYFQWFAADGKYKSQFGAAGVADLSGGLSTSGLNVATSTPTAGAARIGPTAIFATVDGVAVAIAIDSNSVGRGDTGDAAHAQGHLARALRSLSIPYMHVGVSGDQLAGSGSGWLASSAKRQALAKICSDMILGEPAINDITGGRTAVQVAADRLTWMNFWTGMPVAVTNMSPVVTGTYTTVNGQTPSPAYSEIAAYNAATLAGVAGASAIFDVNAMVCAPGDPSRWQPNYTPDGTHFNQASAVAAGALLAPQIRAQFIPVLT